jgi:hypothetical protein
MRVRKVSIVEDTEGWTVGGMVYQSAIEALLAIQREDSDAANEGDPLVTIIEWTAIQE